VRPLILLPREQFPTSEARRALPDQIPREDGVWNLGRASVLVAVLSGAVEATPRLLLEGTDDKIHQPYRVDLMPKTASVITGLRERGIAAALSGAGPSVVCLVMRGEEDRVTGLSAELDGWELLDLDWDREGARIIES
jgi:homoserine kinase